jgi:hypothetical protein
LLDALSFNTSGIKNTRAVYKKTECTDDTSYQFFLSGKEGTFYLCSMVTERLENLTYFSIPIPQDGDHIGYYGADGFLPPNEPNVIVDGANNLVHRFTIQVKKFSQ